MSNSTSNAVGIPQARVGPAMMSAGSLTGDDVYNQKGEDLGDIKELMPDMRSGRVGYAVLSCGGFLGMGDKLFAVPWSALTLDAQNKRLVPKVDKDRLKDAPGFDKDQWPDMADPTWSAEIHSYCGTTPHADESRN